MITWGTTENQFLALLTYIQLSMSYENVRFATTHRENVTGQKNWLSSLMLCAALGISLISSSCRTGSEANAAFPPPGRQA